MNSRIITLVGIILDINVILWKFLEPCIQTNRNPIIELFNFLNRCYEL